MKVYFSKVFDKNYKKLQSKIMRKVDERIILFSQNPMNPILNNHSLHGKYNGCRSINISGDLRAVYKMIDQDIAFFVAFGTHSQLYG